MVSLGGLPLSHRFMGVVSAAQQPAHCACETPPLRHGWASFVISMLRLAVTCCSVPLQRRHTVVSDNTLCAGSQEVASG